MFSLDISLAIQAQLARRGEIQIATLERTACST